MYAQYRGNNDACERGEQFGIQVLFSWLTIYLSTGLTIYFVVG